VLARCTALEQQSAEAVKELLQRHTRPTTA
jgi:hypothetical protein